MRKIEFLFPVTVGCSMLAMCYYMVAVYEAYFFGSEFNYFIQSTVSLIATSIPLVMAIFARTNNPTQKNAKKRFSVLVFLVWLVNFAGFMLVILSASEIEISLLGYSFPKLLSLSRPFFIGMYTFLTAVSTLLFAVSVKYSRQSVYWPD